MPEKNSIVVVYDTHTKAEEAVNELHKTGFDVKKLSILGREPQSEHAVGCYHAGDRMQYWGRMGARWGELRGLFTGAAFLVVPGIGSVFIAGPVAGWVAGALEGPLVVEGLSVIGAGLYSMGIPKNSILRYETALKADKVLLIAHGAAEEVTRAKDILRNTRPEEVNIHFAEAKELSAA